MTTSISASPSAEVGQQARRTVKCVVWDLDGTIWNGTLLEDENVDVRQDVVAAIKELDGRGILHSIASRNDHAHAMQKLRALGIDEFFLHPQISWNDKSDSIAAIAAALNIRVDSMAFVDDQRFEQEEVGFSHPTLLLVDAADAPGLPDRPEFTTAVVTKDARLRRSMYVSSMARDAAEAGFVGKNQEFLATLGMKLTIGPAAPADLGRAEELVVRTNQLNSTGITYSGEQLAGFCDAPDHLLLMAELDDRFGTYGQIGLALIEFRDPDWTLRLLLMSCRVMSRGVGTVLLNEIQRRARAAGATLLAEFEATGRNRVMEITYRFAGFREVSSRHGRSVLIAPDSPPPPAPDYLELVLK